MTARTWLERCETFVGVTPGLITVEIFMPRSVHNSVALSKQPTTSFEVIRDAHHWT